MTDIRRMAEIEISTAQRIIEGVTAELELDAEDIGDLVEGETILDELIDEMLKLEAEDKTMAEAIAERINDLDARRARLKKRADAYRAMIERIMMEFHPQKWERPEATLSLTRAAPKLGDLEEAKIPPDYWVEKDPVLDKKKLLADLKAGAEIPGVAFAPESQRLTIRRR